MLVPDQCVNGYDRVGFCLSQTSVFMVMTGLALLVPDQCVNGYDRVGFCLSQTSVFMVMKGWAFGSPIAVC